MLDIKDYYSELVTIWKGQYDAYWKSIDVFLVVQGILFVAIIQAVIQIVHPIVALGISGIGLSFSIMWLYIGARKVVTLRLLEHQMRHLELELFEQRVTNLNSLRARSPKVESEIEAAIDKVFPMYFIGARAVLLDRGRDQTKYPSYPYEDEIKRHHLKEIPDALSGFGGMSRVKISTYGIPFSFLLPWSIALGMSIGEIIRILL
jgi:hypothetical protein